jgi:hypothetical protein
MIRIQATLILLLVCAALVYLTKLRSALRDRLIVVAFALAGIALILYPSATTVLAHALGVGRGVDLVIYLALIGQGFVTLVLFSRIRTIDQKLADVARALALATAEDGRLASPADGIRA